MKERKGLQAAPILVAVDFSPYSAAALVWAAELAEPLGAPMAVLHVVHEPESAPGYYLRSNKKHLCRLREAASEMMREFLAEVAEAHPDSSLLRNVEPILVPGLPVGRILEVAEDLGARMIVVGSQGRTGMPHVLLGSKAERVAQLSPVPVTIVKKGKEESGGG